VSCSRDNAIKVWDVLSGYCVRTISSAHSDWIRKVSSSDDGALYLSAGNDQVIMPGCHFVTSRSLASGMRKARTRKVNTSSEVTNMS
jgi:platelet-activating factor acetylhydrolase IB subunit alpha